MKTKIQNLIIALAWLALPALVQAQFTFTTNNGAITITDYNTAAGPNVVIPAMTNGYPVTSIEASAFYNKSSIITNVTIPASVTSIGNEAVDCLGLTSINVDAANPAYSSLSGVLFDKALATLLQFPDGLGGSYTIPASVTSIGVYAFDTCTRLTSVTIPSSVTLVGNYAFFHCASLTSVTIPNSVTNIGIEAFYNCASLTNVSFSSGLTSIGGYAFYYCASLTSVTIPASVTSLGDFPFADCYSLTSINVDAVNPAYSSLGGVLFDKAQATLLEFPGGLGGSYTIPASVTSIGQYAFGYCASLTSVTIPASVTSIGQYAFGYCASLTSMTIPASVTSIGNYAFYNCSSLTSAYFLGNAPPDDGTTFKGPAAGYYDPATVYYLAGTTGWGSTFDSRPAVLWNPQANTFSFTGGQFGFNLTGPAYAVIVVEACTNLSHPVWLPVSTNTLSGLGTSAFSDPTGYPMRYYRFRSP